VPEQFGGGVEGESDRRRVLEHRTVLNDEPTTDREVTDGE
jgi:hypothetical protein